MAQQKTIRAVDDDVARPECIRRSKQPFVIVDAPLGWRLRAKWNISVPTTQVVSFRYTNTPNVNDRMRGCPCGGE